MAWLREIGSKSVSLTPKAWDLVSMDCGIEVMHTWQVLRNSNVHEGEIENKVWALTFPNQLL